MVGLAQCTFHEVACCITSKKNDFVLVIGLLTMESMEHLLKSCTVSLRDFSKEKKRGFDHVNHN